MARPIHGLTDAARAAGMPAGRYIPRYQIAWALGRVHVSTTALEVARMFWHKRARHYPRPIKRAAVRVALQEHRKNRDLYAWVMRGNL